MCSSSIAWAFRNHNIKEGIVAIRGLVWKAASSKSNCTLSCCLDKRRAASEDVWRVAPSAKDFCCFERVGKGGAIHCFSLQASGL